MTGKLTPGDACTLFPPRTLKHLWAAAIGANLATFATLRYVYRLRVLVCRAPSQFTFQHPQEQGIQQQVGATECHFAALSYIGYKCLFIVQGLHALSRLASYKAPALASSNLPRAPPGTRQLQILHIGHD